MNPTIETSHCLIVPGRLFTPTRGCGASLDSSRRRSLLYTQSEGSGDLIMGARKKPTLGFGDPGPSSSFTNSCIRSSTSFIVKNSSMGNG